MIKIKEEELKSKIIDLYNFFGVRENIDIKFLENIFNNKTLEEKILFIKKIFNIENEIYINKVNNYNINFHSREIVEFNDSKENQGIIAQIFIPKYVPLYNSNKFKKLSINIFVNDRVLKDFRIFFIVMTHEICHLILHSVRFENDEINADILPRLYGFNNFFYHFNEITEYFNNYKLITNIGYLRYWQNDFVFNEISFLLNKNIKIIKKNKFKIYLYKRIFNIYKKFFYLIKINVLKLKEKIFDKKINFNQKEILIFKKIFNEYYLDEFYLNLNKTDFLIKDLDIKFKNLFFYNENNLKDLENELLKINKFFLEFNEVFKIYFFLIKKLGFFNFLNNILFFFKKIN